MNPPLFVVISDAVSVTAFVTTEIAKGAVQSVLKKNNPFLLDFTKDHR